MLSQCLSNICLGNNRLNLSSASSLEAPPSPVMIELEEYPITKTANIAEEVFKISVTSPDGDVWKWDAAEYPNRVWLSKIENLEARVLAEQARALADVNSSKLIKGPQNQLSLLPTSSSTSCLNEEKLKKTEDPEKFLKVPKKSSCSKKSKRSVNSVIEPLIIENISAENFGRNFKNKKVENVKLGECVFIHTFSGSEDQDAACFCQGVGPNLAVGVICRDEHGIFKGSGLGLFSKLDVKEFCETPGEESNIHLLVRDAYARASKVSIFFIGFYSSEFLKDLEKAINTICRPEKLEIILNPWRLPENNLNRPDIHELEQYFFEQGCNLSVGITENGSAYFANNGGDHVEIYLDKFAEWKKNKITSQHELRSQSQKPITKEVPKSSHIQNEEIVKALESAREGVFSNLKRELIIQTAKDVYNDRANLTLKVDNYKNIENIQNLCKKRNFCLEDLFNIDEAKDFLLLSDRLRKALLFYCTRKLKQCFVNQIYLYEMIINQIIDYSVQKVIHHLNQPVSYTDKEIIYIVDCIYPESIEDFIANPSIKQWFTTEPGKKAALALITSL